MAGKIERVGRAWNLSSCRDEGETLLPSAYGRKRDLGAGKTQLVKGLARGLAITQRVHSPTFALVNIYAGGRLTLFHLDLYRLETMEQILAAGLQEYLEPDGVAVIEWAERLVRMESRGQGSGIRFQPQQILPKRFRSVQIETLGETERRIEYE